MYGIGAGCPGADVLGHRRMGRLTLEHRLNHPRPKEIVTFTSSTDYMSPAGALYADVIVVGSGSSGSAGAAGAYNVTVAQPQAYGGNGGAGGNWNSQNGVKLVVFQCTVVIGVTSSFFSVSSCFSGPVGGAGGGSYYLSSALGHVYATRGGDGVTGNRTLFTGVPVCRSGGGGGGGGLWNNATNNDNIDYGAAGGSPYGGRGGGRYTASPNLEGQPGGNAATGSGDGGGGGGSGAIIQSTNLAYADRAVIPGQGGAGGTGVVQIRFRREF